MGPLNALIAVSVAYVIGLFGVAFAAERASRQGRRTLLNLPLVYTLSLSIYCTAWTFYGAVGYAARSGLEYLTIYLGPSLVLIGWFWLLRRMVRIGRRERITSIADMVSSRYGKSNAVAAGVTLLAVIAATPYISLQLQSVALSYSVFASSSAEVPVSLNAIAFYVALGLAAFTIIFGTRNLDVNERHYGVVMAIAVEAVVKLFALLAVGVFVIWWVADGPNDILQRIEASHISNWTISSGRWAGLIFISAAAFLCLPRMFQVLVVENENEDHLRTASWAFPTYLMLMSLFVVPIAVVGLEVMPAGSNPDMFVLTVPLATGNEALAMLSFIGGFSSATSMVIVAVIAVSTMVSNHIVLPIWLWVNRLEQVSLSGDMRRVTLQSRRLSILVIMLLGYLYFWVSGGGTALASIGFIAFVGMAQVLPSLVGGVLWRGATRIGALAGLAVGAAIWSFTLLLPSFGALPDGIMTSGLFGVSWLNPRELFGIQGIDPVLHAALWSIALNTLVFVLFSLVTFPTPIEREQGVQFVNVFEQNTPSGSWTGRAVQSEELMVMAQRIIGAREAQALFGREARKQGLSGYLPEPTSDFLRVLEREFAGSVGAATAHAMISQFVGGTSVSVQDLMAVADETAQMLEHSSQLEAKSEALERTARQLRQANEKITAVSEQKDDFLSQVSHELRTPMTSIRAFSEILRDTERLSNREKMKYSGIIHSEAERLTRLLDDLLDLNMLENRKVKLSFGRANLTKILDDSISLALAGDDTEIEVIRNKASENIMIFSDLERLRQVFINIVRNAQKYCDADSPALKIKVAKSDDRLTLDFVDNGSGIDRKSQDGIFDKFVRVHASKAGGTGLGLSICKEVLASLGGEISYLPGQGGAAFRVVLPEAATPPVN